MVRAAESVLFNIVEGCGASTQPEFARFLDMSIKSSRELESQLDLTHEYGVLTRSQLTALTAQTIDCRRMLCGLRAKVVLSHNAVKR